MHITVPDPDDPHGMPIYDGDPFTAWQHLEPGLYPCITDDNAADVTIDSATIPVVGLALCVTRTTSFLVPVVEVTQADHDATANTDAEGPAS